MLVINSKFGSFLKDPRRRNVGIYFIYSRLRLHDLVNLDDLVESKVFLLLLRVVLLLLRAVTLNSLIISRCSLKSNGGWACAHLLVRHSRAYYPIKSAS